MDLKQWGVIGHESTLVQLIAQMQAGRLGHAILLTGPSRVGKSLLALRLAQALNCLRPSKERPCGECRSCSRIERGIHPDIVHVEREKSSIKIDAIRAMQSGISAPPLEANQRVVIIHDMQHASGEAMDSLLKTLEEPPRHTRIIVTASAAEDLLPTIVSRCQLIALRLVPRRTIAEALKERAHDIDPEILVRIARMSAGRPGWALQALNDSELLDWRREVFNALKTLLSGNRSRRFEVAQEMAYSDGLPEILDMWQSFWRDALLQSQGLGQHIVNVDQMTAYDELVTQSTTQDILAALRAVRRAQESIGRNANKRITLDVMFLNMPYVRLTGA